MKGNARGLIIFQAVLSFWIVASAMMVSAMAWALLYSDGKRPGINLKEL
jgi:hypothetical protein